MLTLPASPVMIVRSKVERPPAPEQWSPRPRLEARLDQALSRLLTTVVAPPGHGKTTTVVSWLQTRGLDAAWMSVDGRDAMLTRFAAHVAVALDRVAPGVAAPLFALLTAPDRLAPRELGESFGEALYDLARDAILAFDDFHAAGSGAAGEFVDGLLHAAPRRLHAIVISREPLPFPLARLRIAGEVVELSGADLRFSSEETGELLRLETGTEVDPAAAAQLQAMVGGWPAAIRIIGIGFGADESFASPAGAARHEQLVLDYLFEEVLARLPALQRTLLMSASLLDRFNAPLLETLATAHGGRVGRDDLERLRALELYREIPGLDDTWFAYHPLFRDVLGRELARTMDPAVVARLHRGAADWFAAAGMTLDAARRLLAAGDPAAAATLIESRLAGAFAQEDWRSIVAWLQLIPPEELRRRPELLLASAWVSYLSGRESHVVEIQAMLREQGVRELATDAQRAEIALIADPADADAERWLATAEAAVAQIAAAKRYQLGYAQMMIALALTSLGREGEALARLTAFTERESARIDAASIRGYFGLGLVHWQSGRLARCEQVAADQLQLAQMNGLAVSAGWGYAVLGFVAHERGDLPGASRHFESVIAGAERFHFECVRESFLSQILTYEARGRRGEADRALARLREFCLDAETLHHLDLVDSFVARLALIRGDLPAARRSLDSPQPRLLRDNLKQIELPLLTRAKVLVAVGGPDALQEAERLLADLVQFARATHMTLALLEGLAVQALLHEANGDHAAADRALRESLTLAAPERIVQRYAYLGPALAPILRR
ncbi:MAG TPA: hypothetical protein VFQ80_17950, partial [Thermomicrobiales bacterium]|nr:hypothetical protein [Thermomicrobiales bacterium]